MSTPEINPLDWLSRWREALDACLAAGGGARPLVLDPPATESEVASVEAGLGFGIPESFRSVLLGFSATVDFAWFLPSDYSFPEPFDGILSGGCRWSLSGLAAVEERRRALRDERFPDPRDPGASIWREKLAFSEMDNGDLLTLDRAPDAHGSVVCLSGDAEAPHGYRLGEDFADFIRRWSELGCPGAEGRTLMHFLEDPGSLLDCTGTAARQWRKLFGLSEGADQES